MQLKVCGNHRVLISFLVIIALDNFAGNNDPLVINVYSNNNNQLSQNTNVKNQSNLENTSAQNQQLNQPTNKPTEKNPYNLSAILNHYKFYLLAGSLLATYGYFFAKILTDHWFINRSDTWASWKQNIKLDTLQQYPREKLIDELMHNIQTSHLDTDPINASAPLAHFMQNIDYEIKRIQRYLKVSTFLQRTKLLLIFPTNATTIKMARTKLPRAHFVKEVFVSWAADYNMQHILKERTHKKS